MVVVMGSEVKEARNSKELFALFDQGTQNRHTASTSESPGPLSVTYFTSPHLTDVTSRVLFRDERGEFALASRHRNRD